MEEKWNSAREYESVKTRVGQIINESKSRSSYRRTYIRIAASIIILLGIYGIIILVSNNKESDRFAQDLEEVIITDTTSDSTHKDLRFVPQIDEIEYKADIDYYEDTGSLQLLTQNITLVNPISDENYNISDSIVLSWETIIDQEVYLYIYSTSKDTVIYKSRTDLTKGIFIIPANTLKADSYYWFFVSPEKHGKFIISRKN